MKPEAPKTSTHYFVDESGDGVLFGTQGRLLLGQPEGRSHFCLVRCKYRSPNCWQLNLNHCGWTC